MAEISTLAKMFLVVDIDPDDSTVDPTSDTVEWAFTTPGVNPVAGDWVAGSWRSGGPPYVARCLVGPGGGVKTLTAGRYHVWTRITDAPELAVLQSGYLRVS